MDEHREVLEKDLIILKIDDVRDKGGVEIAEKITQGRHYGIPFVTIFDGNEQRLADFDSPLGNIGFPSELEGALHLRRMLDKVRKRITDEELDQLIDSLLNE